ncbi:MAG: hypothetical protein Fur005_04490 [Roseiflexaceae bacterium]
MGQFVSFADWLKYMRRQRDLTREGLAELVSCAPPTLAKIEQGSRRPSRVLAQLLLDALDVPADQHATLLHLARQPLAPPTYIEEEPPLAAVLGAARSLPLIATPLIGREQEQALIRKRLDDPSCRLLTLVGPGGIGKTRLALHIVQQLDHAVVWLDLAPLDTIGHVVAALASIFGCPPARTEDPLPLLIEWLREHPQQAPTLLVLDNAEHLRDLALLIANLLTMTTCQWLVTSRERLQLQAEWVVDLAGLAYPPAARTVSAAIDRYDAVVLFRTRAQQVQHEFSLTPQNRQAVMTICQLLEGWPLGIELAAGWVRSLSCHDIAEQIRQDLDFLAHQHADIPARHRSMRAVLDHSWQLLSPTERNALAALAIFRGGWDITAAQQIAKANVAILAALVDKSLVRVTQREPAVRYGLHEAVRHYAAEQLATDSDTHQSVAERHARYYAEQLAAQLHNLLSAGRAAAFRLLDPDLENLRQAWAWAVAHADAPCLLAMGQSLQAILEDRGWFHQGVAMFERAAAALQAHAAAGQGQSVTEQHTLGHLLGRLGYFRARSGQLPAAWDSLQQSLQLLEPGPPGLALADTLVNLGFVAYQVGEYTAAAAWIERSIALSTQLQIPFYQALGYSFLGMTNADQQQWAAAEQCAQQALAIERQNGQPRGQIIALTLFGQVQIGQSRYEQAQAALQQSLQLSVAAQDRWGLAITLQQLGGLAAAQHDWAEAIYLQREATDLFAQLGERRGQCLSLILLGEAAMARAESTLASESFQQATAIAQAAGLTSLLWRIANQGNQQQP